MDHGTLAGRKLELDPHRLERKQDVGEDDRGVDPERAHRLQRHFGRQLGSLEHFEQTVALPDLSILLQVAPGLTHEPDRRAVDALEPARSEESGGRHSGTPASELAANPSSSRLLLLKSMVACSRSKK